MFSFADAGALVLGAAGGIGRALAQEFFGRGARLVLADIDGDAAAAVAQQVNDAGGKALGLACDITDHASINEAVAAADEFLGGIDLSLNAVGVLLSGHPEDIPFTEWERIFGINVFGAARLTEAVLPQMLARGSGYIVNTASVAGLYPFASTRVPYAASKAALISMSQNMAIHFKPLGIRVTCLCPGPTATPIGNNIPTFTDGVKIVGPGSDYVLHTPRRAAGLFCDGIEAERVLVFDQPNSAMPHMQRWAASPDNFIHEKIGRYACGDTGLPNIDFEDPEMLAALQGLDLPPE